MPALERIPLYIRDKIFKSLKAVLKTAFLRTLNPAISLNLVENFLFQNRRRFDVLRPVQRLGPFTLNFALAIRRRFAFFLILSKRLSKKAGTLYFRPRSALDFGKYTVALNLDFTNKLDISLNHVRVLK